jgi:lactoylglutathione lyase
MSNESPVRELRVALTVDDYEEALRFYRDALGADMSSSVASSPWRICARGTR